MNRLLRSIDAVLFPFPPGDPAEILLAFLAFNALTRLALAAFNGEPSFFLPWRLLPAVAIGAVFDPRRGGLRRAVSSPPCSRGGRSATRRRSRSRSALLLLPLCALMVFVGASELVFWNEFASRFNFIAVDYLVYTNEVIGNIRESYNMPLLLSLVGVVSCRCGG